MASFGQTLLRILSYRSYHAIRFTDEADQQRALIEMHGLYCLSRPSTPLLDKNHAYTERAPSSAYLSSYCQVQTPASRLVDGPSTGSISTPEWQWT